MAVLDRRFLLCLTLLVLNDVVLKPEYGNWVTGKLSDVVGVVVFAVVLAEVLRFAGVDRRWSERGGVALSAVSLVAVKFHAGAAAGVVAAFEGLGIGYDIVVDPTDAIALAALPLALRILRTPQPLISNRSAGRFVFVVACFACAASGQEGAAGLDFVDSAEGGSVQVGRAMRTDEEPVVERVGVLDGNAWRVSSGVPELLWTKTTESCSPVDPNVCLRVAHDPYNPSKIEVSNDGGETFDSAWAVDDGGFWIPPRDDVWGAGRPSFYAATDIEWTDDGRAVVAMSDRFPIVRETTGDFTPSIADLHAFPMLTWALASVSSLLLVVGAWTAHRYQTTRAMWLFVTSALAALGGSFVSGAFEGFGLLASVLSIPVVAFFALFGVGMLFASSKHGSHSVQPVSLVKLLWPLPLIALAAFAWDFDFVSWIAMIIVMTVALGAQAFLTIPTLRSPRTTPPPLAAPPADQPATN